MIMPRGAWALQFLSHLVSVEAGVVKNGGIAIGDIDGDSDSDIVTAGSAGITAYVNDGLNGFTREVVSNEAADRVRLVDVNSDEKLDLLVLRPEQSAVWYDNKGGRVFSRTDFATESEAYATVADLSRETDYITLKRDLDDDGDEDALTVAQGEVYWLENVGEEQFTRHGLLTDLENVGGVVLKDIDGDDGDDIVAADTVRGALYWYEGKAVTALSSHLPSPTPISTLNGNQPPAASAGEDQTVQPDALVMLDGRKSLDPDNDALTYEWRQLAGPTTELLSGNTAEPSFIANSADEAYVFMLTVKDSHGASAVDTVTVATRGRIALLLAAKSSVETVSGEPSPLAILLEQWLPWASAGWLVLALLPTLWLASQRWLIGRREYGTRAAPPAGGEGRVLHYQTGQPIAGAQIFIYDRNNKLRATERTNDQGAWPTLFPPGGYSLKIAADGFEMASSASAAVRPVGAGILYAGGFFTVPEQSGPLTIVIPVRPLIAEARVVRRLLSHGLQAMTQVAHMLAWPVIGVGVVFSTGLLFWRPSVSVLIVECLYVGLIALRMAIGWHARPAYGIVREYTTKTGVDLAVVRLFAADTNRLVMTRVTNSQGRFFVLPPAGLYTVTVTKPGYTAFTKEKVAMGERNEPPLTVDLLPLVPVV